MMEAAGTSETSVNLYQTTRCYNPEVRHLPKVKLFTPAPRMCRAVVPKRCVATPWCVARDHDLCREIKKYIFKLILIMIKN
jgi:hypothetical protein